MKNSCSIRLYSLVFFLLLVSCNEREPQHIQKPASETAKANAAVTDSLPAIMEEMPEIEKQFLAAGLVDVRMIDSTIKIDLKYSSCDNFLFLDMYGDLNKCYLQAEVAEKLSKAQQMLKDKFPYYSLIIFDGVRPRSIQFMMWDTIAVPAYERSRYVSNPLNGSLHNFGAAVDLSIIDENGIELDMGTAYDYFGELAYPREEQRMIDEGKLTYKQLFNRQILREAMLAAGFMSITTEWWHFNSCTRNEAIIKYKIVE
jgi:zinc D-Ala-D-Ala dipeptidase